MQHDPDDRIPPSATAPSTVHIGRDFERHFGPGRQAYRSPEGAAGWVGTLSASRRLGPVWVGVYTQADALNGAAFASSPLVRQRTNISGGIGMSWVFKESTARAKDGS